MKVVDTHRTSVADLVAAHVPRRTVAKTHLRTEAPSGWWLAPAAMGGLAIWLFALRLAMDAIAAL